MKRYAEQIAHLVLAVLFLTMVSCDGSSSGSDTGSGSRQWTYMVYMGADNNLSSEGLDDMNEMETVGSSGSVAIVVQAEFSTNYTPGVPSNTNRIYVVNDNDTGSVSLDGTDIGNVDMGTPAALTDFINWAKTNYPAAHYALVIWDHGAGWKVKELSSPAKGAVQDETSGSFMSLPDLAKGVADSGVHFDIINFDACLMGMYEVAYEFNGLADYLVFSEHTEPGEGDPYDTILAPLAANPSMSALDLSKTIVTKFDEFYTINDKGPTTKSAIDMSKLATLDTKLLALGAALQSDGASAAVINTARTSTQEYAYEANHDIWALCDYLEKSAAGVAVKAAAAEVKAAVADMVVANETNGADMANSHGLAIYLPQLTETNADELASYAQLACNATARAAASGTWGSYIEKLIEGEGGGTAVLRPGEFGVKIVWTNASDQPCNADLDLYVLEPTAAGGTELYAPWMGQTSPNGFFSADSANSGKSEEYYGAFEKVLAGDYLFAVNYYESGTSCTLAKVRLYFYDFVQSGNYNWYEVSGSPKLMDLSNAWPPGSGSMSGYSDWWIPGYLTRTTDISQFLTGSKLPELNKRSQLIFKYKKGSRMLF